MALSTTVARPMTVKCGRKDRVAMPTARSAPRRLVVRVAAAVEAPAAVPASLKVRKGARSEKEKTDGVKRRMKTRGRMLPSNSGRNETVHETMSGGVRCRRWGWRRGVANDLRFEIDLDARLSADGRLCLPRSESFAPIQGSGHQVTGTQGRT